MDIDRKPLAVRFKPICDRRGQVGWVEVEFPDALIREPSSPAGLRQSGELPVRHDVGIAMVELARKRGERFIPMKDVGIQSASFYMVTRDEVDEFLAQVVEALESTGYELKLEQWPVAPTPKGRAIRFLRKRLK